MHRARVLREVSLYACMTSSPVLFLHVGTHQDGKNIIEIFPCTRMFPKKEAYGGVVGGGPRGGVEVVVTGCR